MVQWHDARHRILVAEDDLLLGAFTKELLVEAGLLVAGPFPDLRRSFETLDKQPVSAAILDIELRDGLSLPLADRLLSEGIPFIFYTAWRPQDIPDPYWEHPMVSRTSPPWTLLVAIAEVLGEGKRHMSEKKTCLIVDDELLIQKYYSILVEQAGYQVCGVAGEGRQAIEKAVELKPDVILMDVRLPGGTDGIQAAREIHHRLASRVIFVTGSNEPSTIRRINEEHPSTILIKPVTPDQLRDALAA